MNDEYHIIQVQKKAVELQRQEAEKKRKAAELTQNKISSMKSRIRDRVVLVFVLVTLAAGGYQFFNVSSHIRNRALIALLILYLGWKRFHRIKK